MDPVELTTFQVQSRAEPLAQAKSELVQMARFRVRTSIHHVQSVLAPVLWMASPGQAEPVTLFTALLPFHAVELALMWQEREHVRMETPEQTVPISMHHALSVHALAPWQASLGRTEHLLIFTAPRQLLAARPLHVTPI